MSNPSNQCDSEDIGTLVYKCSRTAATRAKASASLHPDPPAAADQSPAVQQTTRSGTGHTAKKTTETTKFSLLHTSRLSSEEMSEDDLWLNRYDQLAAFKINRRDFDLPKCYSSNQLGARSRTNLEDGKQPHLAEDILKKLESIEFEWRVRKQDKWDEMFQSLLPYKPKIEDRRYPKVFKENPTLAIWVNTQRQQYRNWRMGKTSSGMTMERARKLESFGFKWAHQC